MIDFLKFTEKLGKVAVNKLGCPEDPKLATANQVAKVYILKSILEVVLRASFLDMTIVDIRQVLQVMLEMINDIESESTKVVESSRNN